MAHYLAYWKPDTADYNLAGDDLLLEHSASGQYNRLKPGDTLWIATAWSGSLLTLLGRMTVGLITDQRTAAKMLGTDEIWDAPYHVLAAPGTAEPMREVDLSDIAGELRFESTNDRLVVTDGRVSASQLQTMRRLTAASGALLQSRWREEYAIADLGDAALAETHIRAGYGDPSTNPIVEDAAVRAATTRLESDGWSVSSIESQKIGYDLRCTRNGDELHVEVKGTRSQQPAFIITEGELRRAQSDPDFMLIVVADALGAAPSLHSFDPDGLFEHFDFEPLAYRAVPGRKERPLKDA